MREVRVGKAKLLETVKSNRERHRELFLRAQGGYRARVVEELDVMLTRARHGGEIRTFVALEAPEDHTSDYDRVIAMLEMSEDDVVALTQAEFANFVQDEWAWSHWVTAKNTAYAVGDSIGTQASERLARHDHG